MSPFNEFDEFKRRVANYAPCRIHLVDRMPDCRSAYDLYISYNGAEASCGDATIKLKNLKEALILCSIASDSTFEEYLKRC